MWPLRCFARIVCVLSAVMWPAPYAGRTPSTSSFDTHTRQAHAGLVGGPRGRVRGVPRIRAALIGAGFVAGVHARAMRIVGAELVGVAASSPARSEEAARALGAARAYASTDEAIADPDTRVVHICTPNNLHAPLARAALAAGKHVVCEKPLALDAAQADELVRVVSDAGVVAAVPFVYRYYPTVAEARERIRSGDAGTVRLIHGSYLQDWLMTEDDDNWRTDRAYGGASRAFADIGSHWCDLAQHVSGERIQRVMARMVTAVPKRRRGAERRAFAGAGGDGELVDVTTEDAATVLFETDSGAVGSVVVSQVSPGRKNRLWLEIDCARAAIAFDQEEPETLWYGRRDGALVLRRAPETLSAAAARLSAFPGGHPQGYGDCFAAFLTDVYDAIRTPGSPRFPTFEDGRVAARITDAVLESQRRGEWVTVDGVPAARLG
jgi:predicted dehydrogenase